MSVPQSSLYEYDLEELTALVEGWGQPAYRARQLWTSLYKHLSISPDQFHGLPGDLQQRLGDEFRRSSLSQTTRVSSHDGNTTKALFTLPDGASIETVLMRYDRRRTLCISTQAGCAMGCPFCATGQMGLIRQLSSGEILEQVLFFARELAQQGERLTHVVLMGMGEPFHNYDACMNAIARLNHPDGFRFGARRFTVSTVGLVPGIERFAAQDSQVNLAVSLHAATDGLRDQLLPVNRRYPLGELMPACRRYVERSGRRITFEWALIRGVNDGLDQARALVELTAGLNCHVNLIPLNPTAAYDGDPAEGSSVAAFRSLLLEHGRPCTVRIRRGIDIQAGCGQLASRRRSNNPG